MSRGATARTIFGNKSTIKYRPCSRILSPRCPRKVLWNLYGKGRVQTPAVFKAVTCVLYALICNVIKNLITDQPGGTVTVRLTDGGERW